MLENINQEQFEHIIDILIVYKQFNPKKDVYLSENSVKGKMDLCGRRAWTQEMVLDEIRHLWLRFQNTMEHSHSLESLSEIPSPAAVTYSGERRRPDLEPLHTALLSCGLDGWRPMTAIRVGIMECMAYLLE